jgi:hypothetical protein
MLGMRDVQSYAWKQEERTGEQPLLSNWQQASD